MNDRLLDEEQARAIGSEAARTFGMGVSLASDGALMTVSLLNGEGAEIGSSSAGIASAVTAALAGLTWDDLPDAIGREEVGDVD